ncbi:hypothetical protein ACM66B_005283 [Microbotryomycetes sp. NB124-2]
MKPSGVPAESSGPLTVPQAPPAASSSTSSAAANHRESRQPSGSNLFKIPVGAKFASLDEFKLALHRGTLPNGVKYCVLNGGSNNGGRVDFCCRWHGDPQIKRSKRCSAQVTVEHVDKTSSDSPVIVTTSEMSLDDHDHPLTDETTMEHSRKLCAMAIKTVANLSARKKVTSSSAERPSSKLPLKRRVAKTFFADEGLTSESEASDAETSWSDTDGSSDDSFQGREEPSRSALKQAAVAAFPKPEQLKTEIQQWRKSFEIEKQANGTWKVVKADWTHSHPLDKATFTDVVQHFKRNQRPFYLLSGGDENNVSPKDADSSAGPGRVTAAAFSNSYVATPRDSQYPSSKTQAIDSTHEDVGRAPARSKLTAAKPKLNDFASALPLLLSKGAKTSRLVDLAPLLFDNGVDSKLAFVDLIVLDKSRQEEVLDKYSHPTIKMIVIDRKLLLSAFAHNDDESDALSPSDQRESEDQTRSETRRPTQASKVSQREEMRKKMHDVFPSCLEVDDKVQELLVSSPNLARPDDRTLKFKSSIDLVVHLHAYTTQHQFLMSVMSKSKDDLTAATFRCLVFQTLTAKRLKVDRCDCKVKIRKERDGTWSISAAEWKHSHDLSWVTYENVLRAYGKRGIAAYGALYEKRVIKSLQSTLTSTAQTSVERARSLAPPPELSAVEEAKRPPFRDTSLIRGEQAGTSVCDVSDFLAKLLGNRDSRLAKFAPLLVKHGVTSVQAFGELVAKSLSPQKMFLERVARKEAAEGQDEQLKLGLAESLSLLDVFAWYKDGH